MTGRNSDLSAGLPLIDARGMKCPWPVLRAARAMREARAFRLLADDPVAATDLPLLAVERGWSCASEPEGQAMLYTLSPPSL